MPATLSSITTLNPTFTQPQFLQAVKAVMLEAGETVVDEYTTTGTVTYNLVTRHIIAGKAPFFALWQVSTFNTTLLTFSCGGLYSDWNTTTKTGTRFTTPNTTTAMSATYTNTTQFQWIKGDRLSFLRCANHTSVPASITLSNSSGTKIGWMEMVNHNIPGWDDTKFPYVCQFSVGNVTGGLLLTGVTGMASPRAAQTPHPAGGNTLLTVLMTGTQPNTNNITLRDSVSGKARLLTGFPAWSGEGYFMQTPPELGLLFGTSITLSLGSLDRVIVTPGVEEYAVISTGNFTTELIRTV